MKTRSKPDIMGPICGVTKYRNTIQVRRTCPDLANGKGEKRPLRSLSRSSLNRLAFTAHNANLKLKSMLTLTYSERWTRSGRQAKSQLNYYLTRLRRLFVPLSYLWFLEFQVRGAPHFHVLLSVPVDEDLRGELARLWVMAVSPENGEEAEKMRRVHTHRAAWEDLRSEDGAKRYALKYALKTKQKEVPVGFQDVGRFWGCSRDISRSANEVEWQADLSEWDARKLIAALGRDMDGWGELPKYVFLPSEFDGNLT